MAVKVFIDGQEGTTGLKILERFKNREDIQILTIDDSLRKDVAERKKLINSSDYTFLCLPDVAAKEAVTLVENENVKIIDASTAHRTNPDWTYGFPELSEKHREDVKNAKRLAVPGCYASGFVSIVYPLIQHSIIENSFPVFSYATSGYSGGGKKLISDYESENRKTDLNSPRLYALSQNHKHLPEMKYVCGLENTPMFNPMVCDYFSGMVVSVPLQLRTLSKKMSMKNIYDIFADHYKDQKFISIENMSSQSISDGFLASSTLSDTNKMQIFILGNDEQVLLCSRLDNLGKGASGAAVQCLNIMMGIDETTGLI